MWLINLTLLFCTFFDSVYTLCVRFFSYQCTPQHVRQGVSDSIEFFDRFILIFLWVYPVIYVFWPGVRVKKYEQNYKRSICAMNEIGITESVVTSSSFSEAEYRKA